MYPVSSLWAKSGPKQAEFSVRLGAVSLGTIVPESWEYGWESNGRLVTSSLSMRVADPRAVLSGPGGPLQWAGHQVVMRASTRRRTYAESIPVGVTRISDVTPPDRVWSEYRNGRLSRRGGVVSVQAVDLLSVLEDDTLARLEQPAAGGTVWSELTRLTAGRIPITASWPFGDASVPSSVTYSESRLSAMCSLASSRDAVLRVGRSGEVTASMSGPVVWRATARDVARISVSGDPERIYNVVEVEGAAEDGTAVYGSAQEGSGPFSALGPFGRRVYRHHSPLAKTVSQADLTARTMLANLIAGRAATMTVSCLWDPSLDPLDRVQVTDAAGTVLSGPVTAMRATSDGLMDITVPVPLGVVL